MMLVWVIISSCRNEMGALYGYVLFKTSVPNVTKSPEVNFAQVWKTLSEQYWVMKLPRLLPSSPCALKSAHCHEPENKLTLG